MPVANYVPPLPDELLFSWICRMADVNAIVPRRFYARFLSHSGPKSTRSTLRYDSCSRLEGLLTEFTSFPALSHEEDALSFFIDHSMYGALAPFLPGPKQQRLLSVMFGDAPAKTGCEGLLKGRTLKACPRCMQERGIRYFRVHQLPSVTVCPIHGCRLRNYTGRVGNEFSEDAFFSEMEGLLPSLELEEEYAQFYATFFNTTIDCSSIDVEVAVNKKLYETIYRPSYGPSFDMWLEYKYGYIRKDFHLNMPQFTYSDNPYKVNIPMNQLMMLVFLLFESAEELRDYLPSFQKTTEAFNSIIKEEHLKLLSPYRMALVYLQDDSYRIGEEKYSHKPHKFICTVPALVSGQVKP